MIDALEAAMGGGPLPDLVGCSAAELDAALRELGRRHGATAAPLLRRLADEALEKDARKTARRELYRLAQAGVPLPAAAAPTARPLAGPLIRRQPERATAAWLSGIDGSGSRAAWIVFEGGLGGGLRLCSLILNDEVGILESAGGPVTRRRLEAEQRALRESQKLPWVSTPPERAAALVAEALALHAAAGSPPPPAFARWRPCSPAPPPIPSADAAPPHVTRAAGGVSLLDLPELGGWFVDARREDAVALERATAASWSDGRGSARPPSDAAVAAFPRARGAGRAGSARWRCLRRYGPERPAARAAAAALPWRQRAPSLSPSPARSPAAASRWRARSRSAARGWRT
jgi:hypothetical protein